LAHPALALSGNEFALGAKGSASPHLCSELERWGERAWLERRALERGKLLVAEATAKEIGRLSLAEALELTLLIAREDPRRHPRVAARWLRLFLDESLDVTIAEAAIVATSLAALTGRGGDGRRDFAGNGRKSD
jgi:hypothetical protein